MTTVDVFVVYRGASCSPKTVVDSIWPFFNPRKSILVCGDINVCFNKHQSNGLVKFFMSQGFEQLVSRATHIDGGLIDHVYFRNGAHNVSAKVSLYSPYYTANDHDAVCIELFEPLTNTDHKVSLNKRYQNLIPVFKDYSVSL